MKPNLIANKQIGKYHFWLSNSGRVGTTFSLSLIDLELTNPQRAERRIQLALKHLPEELYLKWHLFSDVLNLEQPEHARASAIETIGQTSCQVLLHVELKTTNIANKLTTALANKDFFDVACEKLFELLPIQAMSSLGLRPKPVPFNIVASLLPANNSHLSYGSNGIDTGTEIIGILKLDTLSDSELSYISLACAKDELPQPFEIVVHQKKINRSQTKRKVSAAEKRESRPENSTDYSKAVAAQDAKRKVELLGYSHFNFEMHIVLRRTNESQLKNDLKEAQKTLAEIGDFLIESPMGAEPSYLSTIPGTPFHYSTFLDNPLEEEMNNLPCYLPIFTRGSVTATPSHPSAFAFHRLDFTVDFFTIYDRRYKNYCANVIGDSGAGKSVWINRLITCSANSPKAKTIIVDVRGSHTHLVNRLGGSVHEIDLDQASGINPFSYIKNDRTEYTIGVVTAFASDLLLLEDEVRLPEELAADLSDLVIQYAASKPTDPSIDDFLENVPDEFPRKKLLKRFSSKGLHKNLFKPQEAKKFNNKILYFNFANIDTAANRSAARAIMSSILAEVNQSLRNKDRDEEILFFCDEAPFFLEACFETFKYLSKNMRKLLGALLISVQVSQDLIIKGDRSLVDGAGTTVFLSWDDEPETFMKRFKLSQEQASIIFALESEKGQYSQFAIKDRLGLRVGNLILEDREYWESTTEGEENARLEQLQKHFPDLSTELLISLLGHERKTTKQSVSAL